MSDLELETRERIVRIETKLDVALETLKTVAVRQRECPARQAYLSHRTVQAEDDLRRQRWISRIGWIIAIIGGVANLAPPIVAFLKRIF